MASGARPPAVAGRFYAADGRELAAEVERCFTDPRGPGGLPARRRESGRRLVAAIVPHAGLRYSGAIAAHVYARVAAERPPESVVILGVDHHGAASAPALSGRPWQTPLGPTGVDAELVRALDHPPLTVDERAHAREHSIEVQLPFLEYVLPRPRFVALEVPFGPLASLVEIGHRVRDAVRGRDALLLASSDFSHYVPAATADRLDHRALEAILAGDAAALYAVVLRERISMCGIAPVTALLGALADRPLATSLLRWGHSGEVEPMEDVVGYAAVAFEERAAPS